MKCPSPMSIPRPDGKGSKDRITIPCGKCVQCLSNRRADWSFRLEMELKDAKTAHFLTLTYGNNKVIQLDKDHVQKFVKRLRKRCENPIKYYLCGEYGPQTGRAHYHAIFFNVPNLVMSHVADIWGQGFVQVGTVGAASIKYCTKYMIQMKEDYGIYQPPFSVMSKGLGENYAKKNSNWHKEHHRTYVQINGVKQRMPKYYKEKIFSVKEKMYIEEEQIKNEDIRANQTFDNLSRMGENPFVYEDYRIKQETDRIIKNAQKSKL